MQELPPRRPGEAQVAPLQAVFVLSLRFEDAALSRTREELGETRGTTDYACHCGSKLVGCSESDFHVCR
ncbi:unnamed protein product [Rangifer tarandus platyrhynchus]|uniref:Uncharacterized protein n=1 Tax=Rangifer tarandus platyrhynchus TaxID=3082113 RepID=A0AC59ZL33_RANTA